jgi:hypothetical protein
VQRLQLLGALDVPLVLRILGGLLGPSLGLVKDVVEKIVQVIRIAELLRHLAVLLGSSCPRSDGSL